LLVPLFHHGWATFEQTQQLAALRSWQTRRLVVLEGTQYFSSHKISCPHCATPHPTKGPLTCSHRLLTPGIGAPGQEKGMPLPPEFIGPPEGHDKHDGENAAAKPWLRPYARYYRAYGIPLLGADLYANHPLGAVLVEEQVPFRLVGKPDSPPPL
jgi:hypothetical protein